MDTAADLITDPVARDEVLRRHFSWELGKLLRHPLPRSRPGEQVRVQEGIRKLAETYLTDDVRASLDVKRRVLLSIAQYGALDDLLAVIPASRGARPGAGGHRRRPLLHRLPRLPGPGPRLPRRLVRRHRRRSRAPCCTRPAGRRALGTDRRRATGAAGVAGHSPLPNLTVAGDPPPRVFAGDGPPPGLDSQRRTTPAAPACGPSSSSTTWSAGAESPRRQPAVKFTWTTRGEAHSQPVTAATSRPRGVSSVAVAYGSISSARTSITRTSSAS